MEHNDGCDNDGFSEKGTEIIGDMPPPLADMSKGRKYTCFAVLCAINLLNYMDRYTVAGVLTDVQDYYDINDAQGGLVQTMFMAFYIVFSPICGYLGDRYNRKWLMVGGIGIWVCTVLASSFMPKDAFWAFLLLRGIVGIGEASYAIMSPSIISDMFTGLQRSRCFMIFYFAIPVGSGLGFIVGAAISSWTGHWQWAIRVTSILGIICEVLIILLVREPERGRAERDSGEIGKDKEITNDSYFADMKAIVVNPTYMFSTFGYTAIVFMVGTLAWWAPSAILYMDAWQQNKTSISGDDGLDKKTYDIVNGLFGLVMLVGGFIGVSMGTLLSNMMTNGVWLCRYIKTRRSDAIMCAIGSIIAIPTLFGGLMVMEASQPVMWIMFLICVTGSCFNWAINVDILVSVVAPQRRSTANSWQILISHLLGDGSGPYILGAISDAIRGDDDSMHGHYRSLVISFYIAIVYLVLSAVLYVASAITILKDQEKMLAEMRNSEDPSAPNEDFDESAIKSRTVTLSSALHARMDLPD